MKELFLSLLFMISLSVQAQIVDRNGQIYYSQVFVDTDDFGFEYLDVMERNLKNLIQDTLRYRVINDLGYHYHTRNLKKSLEIINQGLIEVRQNRNELWEGRMQVSKGAILLRMEKLNQAEDALESALTKMPERETWLLLTNLGYVHERRGDLSKAFEYATKTLQLGEKYQDKKAIAMAYSDISNLFWKQGKYEKGVEYGLKSIALFEERGLNDLDFDFTLHVLGNNLMELARFEEALPYYQRSTVIGKQYGFYNNLSDTYIALTDLYKDINDFSNAELSGNEALKYAELLENDFMIVRSLLSLGKLKNQQNEYHTAIAYLQRSIKAATDEFGDKYFLGLIYQQLALAYEGVNNIPEAYKAFKKYNELMQLVFNAEADERIAQLQTEMDVAQKENTISLQTERLKQQQITQLFILILAGVMVIFLFLLFRVFIRKKKYSLLLEEQNKEKEFLLKEIHHRVKNNLETISSLLSLQTAHLDNDELKDIMRESQNRVQSMGIIHQNLYQGANLAAIEMKNYFENLAKFIIHSFDMTDQVEIFCQMDKMELNVDKAIPIGLIVNEIITNSLKYAFPNGRSGAIGISMREENSILHLSISDNGVGMANKPQIRGTGFGSQLITLLTKQLEGKMTLNIQQGTEVVFEFQIDKAA